MSHVFSVTELAGFSASFLKRNIRQLYKFGSTLSTKDIHHYLYIQKDRLLIKLNRELKD
jgi:hypothetical protein